MEDNDKRNSSVPQPGHETARGPFRAERDVSNRDAGSGHGHGTDGPTAAGIGGTTSTRPSDPDMFDAHEDTLPRFTIDPGELPPTRQRTRTLLGVPSRLSDDVADAAEDEREHADDHVFPVGGKLASAILDAESAAPAQTRDRDDGQIGQEALDITVEITDDISDDDSGDVTIVSDGDVISLADSTGKLAPVRIEPETPETTDAEGASAAAVGGAAALAASANSPTSASPDTTAAAPGAGAAADQKAAAPRSAKGDSTAKRAGDGRPVPPGGAGGDDNSGRWGALLVAAVMLLATGVWYLTSGTFRRATVTELAASTQGDKPAAPAANPAAKAAPAQAPTAPPAATPMAEADSEAAPALVHDQDTALSAAPQPTTTEGQPSKAVDKASAEDEAAGPGLRNKAALTASVRGDRVRRSARPKKSRATATASEPSEAGGLPQGPTRAEVVARLESVRPAVRACAAGRSGVADLDITISHTGVVMHVLVGGDFAGTTEGSCIARAVRQARFPAFKQERFRLLYPYAI